MAEGFSLPLVEGLAANVPVVCSDIPVHREVAGDFAEKVNALEHQDWADMFGSIHSLKRPSEKLGLQLFGERCKYFSKERMVEEHIKAYESV
jgi:glycosyltransferase involved in cell wall biosynthesis